MRRRWLTGLAVFALWLLAPPARSHEPIPTPPVWEDPAAPAAPAPAPALPPPAAETPPAGVVPAPAGVVPAPPVLEAPWPSPGSPSAIVVPPPSPARVPLARRWWFWAALGGAAVGLVAGAIAISPREPYVGNANPGLVSPIF